MYIKVKKFNEDSFEILVDWIQNYNIQFYW